MRNFFKTNQIAQKLIVALILFSSAITILTTAIQLFSEYDREVDSIDSYFKQIERSYIGSIAENVWEVDTRRLNLLVEGIVEFPNFIHSAVWDKNGNIISVAGQEEYDSESIQNLYPLKYIYRGESLNIGRLEVTASLHGVYDNTLERIGLILVSNAIKTFLIAVFLFMVIHWLLTRHLNVMANFTRKMDFSLNTKPLSLDRGRFKGGEDEVDFLAASLNEMQLNLRRIFQEKRESEELYKDVVEGTDQLITIVDMEGRFTFVNHMSKIVFGLLPEECIGLSAFDFIHPDDHAKTMEMVEKFIENNEETITFENRQINQDGSVRDLAWDITMHQHANPKLTTFTNMARDVTLFKRAEASLEESERRISEIFAIAPEAIMTIGSDMKIQLFNQGAERIFGYKAEEIIGHSMNILMPEGFRKNHHKHVKDFDESADTYRLMDHRDEVFGLRKNGDKFPAAASVSKLGIGDEKIYTVMLHDVSERNRAEEERKKALVEAERANRAKSDFMSSMSHELRSPLNSILGFADMISKQYLGPVTEKKYVEYADNIILSGSHLLGLVNQILDIERIHAGKYDIMMEYVDVEDLLDECQKIMQNQSDRKKVSLSFDASNCISALFADRRAIMQVLINLITNSIKFTPEGGRILVKISEIDSQHIIEVIDTGQGIPKEKLISIKDPFMRHENNPHLAIDGVGLGLAISNSLVELHSGSLNIFSDTDKGTTVKVILPALSL